MRDPLSHMAVDLAVNSDSFDPTDMLLRVRPEFLWYLHLKEPACVVGEHKQLCRLILADFLRPLTGEVGIEEGGVFTVFAVSTHRSGTLVFDFS